MDKSQQIFSFLESNGPSLPAQVAKNTGDSLLIAGAHLSEMVSSKKIRLSNLKVGGSPLYFVAGHEIKLEDFSSNLHGPEIDAFNHLKQSHVLRDKDQTPVVRVALREIKDFAFPLEVSFEGNKEIFWRWHQISTEDAQPLIQQELKKYAPAPEATQPSVEPGKTVEQSTESEHNIDEPSGTKATDTIEEKSPEKVKEETPVKKEVEKQTSLSAEKPATKPAATKSVAQFEESMHSFFSSKEIEVIDSFNLKKQSGEFVVSIPSAVGAIKQYCVVKQKKTVNEGDLSAAFVIAQSKQMPLLFLTTGKLTKKAQAMLENEFKHITFMVM